MNLISNTFITEDAQKKVIVPLIINTLDNGSKYSCQNEFETIVTQIRIDSDRIASEALTSIKDFLINDDISDSEKNQIDKNMNSSSVVAFYLSYSAHNNKFIFSTFISDLNDYVWDVGFNTDSISASKWKVEYIEHGDDIKSFKKCYGI